MLWPPATVLFTDTLLFLQYEIYLFQCILLCCKEIAPGKNKDKKDKTRSTSAKPRNKNTKMLQLKGRIFMTNVTDVVAMSKSGTGKQHQLCFQARQLTWQARTLSKSFGKGIPASKIS